MNHSQSQKAEERGNPYINRNTNPLLRVQTFGGDPVEIVIDDSNPSFEPHSVVSFPVQKAPFCVEGDFADMTIQDFASTCHLSSAECLQQMDEERLLLSSRPAFFGSFHQNTTLSAAAKVLGIKPEGLRYALIQRKKKRVQQDQSTGVTDDDFPTPFSPRTTLDALVDRHHTTAKLLVQSLIRWQALHGVQKSHRETSTDYTVSIRKEDAEVFAERVLPPVYFGSFSQETSVEEVAKHLKISTEECLALMGLFHNIHNLATIGGAYGTSE